MIFGLYLVAIAVCILIHWLIVGKPRTAERAIEIALLYLLVIGGGVSGMIAFISHAFYADATARSIGWQPGSPFQFEIAIANLSYGVLGLMCIRMRGPFWLATGLATSILLLGCNYGHLYQALVNHNYSPDNYGAINVFEIVWPAAVLILLIPYMRAWNQRRVALTA
jgi:hypothetical protein